MPFTKRALGFLRGLARHNEKPWFEAHRDEYEAEVRQPMRDLIEDLDTRFARFAPEIGGDPKRSMFRINRDIRFARDKTPYRPQMYLTFPDPAAADEGRTQLYVGISAETVTAGFRTYAMGSAKKSRLTQVIQPRVASHAKWLVKQKTRLGRRYESYWYSTEKGEWTKHTGWPVESTEWKKLQGWVVRRKFSSSAATRSTFVAEIHRLFCDVYPLFAFVSSPSWKS